MYTTTRMLHRSIPTVSRSTVRSLHLTPPTSSPSFPPNTQGHATDKAHQTGHKDADVQSASVRAGQDAKAKSTSRSDSGKDADEPFDAARQGGEGGQAKGDDGATGSMRDQIGGQDEPHKGPGVELGEKEEASGGGIREKVKEAVGGFNGLKEMRKDGRNFSTSTRVSDGTTPRTDPDGPRKPVEKQGDSGVKGGQSSHLKHTSGGSSGGKDQGNASSDPHLPSKSKTATRSDHSGGSKRSFSTSGMPWVNKPASGYAKAIPPEPAASGYDAPPEALPSTLRSSYQETDPDAIQPPSSSATPSSKAGYSSTAVDPPHPTLSKAAKDGTLAERNGQPPGVADRQGLGEAWKHRK